MLRYYGPEYCIMWRQPSDRGRLSPPELCTDACPTVMATDPCAVGICVRAPLASGHQGCLVLALEAVPTQGPATGSCHSTGSVQTGTAGGGQNCWSWVDPSSKQVPRSRPPGALVSVCSCVPAHVCTSAHP